MSEKLRFDEAKKKLDDIVTEVRKKDTTLEQAIDLLEEGVRLANVCTERIDETGWRDEIADEEAGSGERTDAGDVPRNREIGSREIGAALEGRGEGSQGPVLE